MTNDCTHPPEAIDRIGGLKHPDVTDGLFPSRRRPGLEDDQFTTAGICECGAIIRITSEMVATETIVEPEDA